MQNLQPESFPFLAPERVLTRPLERIAYASDASFYRLIPQAVVQPISVNEIRALFEFSHEHEIPLTFRAAGTSLSGQAVSNGILVDLSKHWRKIQIEDEGSRIRLQPGVIGAHANQALRSFARRIGPDPASIDACMLGGILANNASGMCCGVVENAYHTLHSLTVFLPNGLLLDTADPSASDKLWDSAPELAQGLLNLRSRLLADPELTERVRARYQRKNTTGYSLNALLDYSAPLDILSHLLIGSEGTLGFIAEAVLNTLPDYPLKATGLLYFNSVQEAADALPRLIESGARALEIMDRASLRSVETLPGAPEILRTLPERAAAILVEYQAASIDELDVFRQRADLICPNLGLLQPATFSIDPAAQAALWKLRKGLFPAIGATRRQGTSVIIEDLAFPVEKLGQAITDLQDLFIRHGYPDGIIYGHAKDGNLHFSVAQSFNEQAEIARYARFMDELVALVTEKYDGALKAEHGTGRNMAPFVEREWGATAYGIMLELKKLFDPTSLLNPGVLINPDPQAHLQNLKSLPVVESEVDRCIECGFCESKCPSRRLTLTPRQRIVLRREMARQRDLAHDPVLLTALEADFQYTGLDTCAVDGLCATACPVNINTGDLVKHMRATSISERGQRIALWLSEHFAWLERGLGLGVRLAHLVEHVIGVNGIISITQLAEKLTGLTLPKWNAAVPHATQHVPVTSSDQLEYVYFPSCITRTMGFPPGDKSMPDLLETLTTLSRRAHIQVWIPPQVTGLCCGMPFGSKGYTLAYRDMLSRTLNHLWDWSQQGRLPVVLDASSCAYTLRTCNDILTPADHVIWEKLTILDPIEYAHDVLLPRLEVHLLPEKVILHPNCAGRKLGLQDKLLRIAQRCAVEAIIPQNLDCCGFAGDRGLLYPELTASATALESEEVRAHQFDGYYSSNLTCEIGMALATDRPYRSILYLLEKASSEKEIPFVT
jgi:D-lactate dehydrogenase